jgi:hypothetical protein
MRIDLINVGSMFTFLLIIQITCGKFGNSYSQRSKINMHEYKKRRLGPRKSFGLQVILKS